MFTELGWLVLLAACGGPAPDVPTPAAPAPGRGATPPGQGTSHGPTQGRPGGFHAEPVFDLEPAVAGGLWRSVVLVSLDTVRADQMSLYGGPAQTPVLAGFAAGGVRFDQAMSHFPETCQSHWSMMSGVLPEVHGNVPPHGGSVYSGPTVAEIAHQQGYATAAFIGGLTLTDESCGLARGFDTYDDHIRADGRDLKRPGAEVTRLAVDWIGRQQGPYFAFVHYFDAHFPYDPPPPWHTRYDPDYRGTLTGSDADLDRFRRGNSTPDPRDVAHVLALYDGEISETDAFLQAVFDAAGPDAVVIVTSDHGESFEHGYWFNHAHVLWDSVLHVPLVIRAPELPVGAVVGQQVGLVDVAPTLLRLAGLPVDRRMQGQSLVPLARGEGGEGRTEVFSITDPWMQGAWFSARTPTHKLVQKPDVTEIYDLLADPGETVGSAEVPAALARAGERYRAEVQSLSAFQVPAPAPRMMGPGEVETLRVLGYSE